ncbi:GNAT family N-acetyltransferase [uncultured Tenacibaculum sp.]|uniref:GNAT family N-acetyltransferase n=1 Tax=uncultured Tenacibaculum sp. TaxID=174713 RepID=UPI00261A1EA4|nr:GNAT family N-acetyltransferase [uncultured Tenacibaculum sp.]
MKIQKLDWDTDFFGYEIAKFEVNSNKSFEEKEFKESASKFNLVYIFSDVPLESKFIKLVDTKLILHKEVKPLKLALDENVKKFDRLLHSYEELLALGYASGIHSRFRNDSQFVNGEFKKLYKKWIDVSINRPTENEILVFENKNKLTGLVTYDINNINISKIGLVAVSQEARGLGIATKLLNKTMIRLYEKGIKRVEVATQNNNLPAVSLYEKCGFTKKKVSYIYHYWNL